MNENDPSARRRADRGNALPLVLVLVTVIAASVMVLAKYTLTDLKYARVTEDRSDRLSAADAGLRYAIDQLKLRNAGCILDDREAVLPGVEADFNGATASVTCVRETTGFEGIQAYAAVLTGEGLAPGDPLLTSQAGSNSKILGGPVFMTRVDPSAFSLSPPVNIENGPLLYHDSSGASPCTSVSASTLPSNLIFKPELIFGPMCVSVEWSDVFHSPETADLSGLAERDGSLDLASSPPLPAPQGSYTDISGGGGCRIFEPGRYTTPPDIDGMDAYFLTGDYVFDFAGPWRVKQGNVVAGRINPLTTDANELGVSAACEAAQATDPAPPDVFGATFYFTGDARLEIETQGAVEVHARQHGANYTSIQTLCTPNSTWCRADADGGIGGASTLTTGSASSDPPIIFTDSGNQKELVTHALVYAPLARIEFGNVTNTATQKMLGGLVASELVLQSSTSATNFEISVPTSPITARIVLTSRAIKNGETSVQAVVEYRPYEELIEDRVRINSWRVCEDLNCANTMPPVCGGADALWTAQYWDNPNLSGSPDFSETMANLSVDWGTGSPDPSIPSNGFSARFSRTVDLPSAGTYRFTVGSDDGQRLYVDGVLVSEHWYDQSLTAHTVDVEITDPCGVELRLDYYENTGYARAYVNWAKL